MSKHTNLNSLFKEIEKVVNDSLKKEVSKMARNTLKEHVIEDVYEKYTPTLYERTGGLYQDENIETEMVDDATLSIRSTREEDGKDIAAIIESGQGYTWTDSRIYKMQPYPRPFHELTAKEIEDNDLHVKALRDGLKRQGIDSK